MRAARWMAAVSAGLLTAAVVLFAAGVSWRAQLLLAVYGCVWAVVTWVTCREERAVQRRLRESHRANQRLREAVAGLPAGNVYVLPSENLRHSLRVVES